MTTCELDKHCDDDRIHRGRGPWDTYIRALQTRRRKCSQPAVTDFEVFRESVDQWRRETWHMSSVNRRVSHHAYLKIIGLGTQAVPWIIQELRQEADYWFPALEALARDNFSPQATSMKELRDAWLAWGEANAKN